MGVLALKKFFTPWSPLSDSQISEPIPEGRAERKFFKVLKSGVWENNCRNSLTHIHQVQSLTCVFDDAKIQVHPLNGH